MRLWENTVIVKPTKIVKGKLHISAGHQLKPFVTSMSDNI